MNCFSCFTSQKSKKNLSREERVSAPQEQVTSRTPDEGNQGHNLNIQAQTFTFRELATATKNFRQECLLGEGGFGRVYKGTIPASGKVVAVKQLDRNGMHGSRDFLTEVAVLSHLNHENLVNLVGYCADGDQRLLVYEYMSGGSADSRLFELEGVKPPIDWFTRMKIASGAARGLEYLHDKANPPVVYRDLKSSNILLDDDLNPKLSDFGLAKLSGGDKMNLISPGVTGTYGYSAPEYIRTGHLTLKSDVYGFGVVLLELISGRRAIDTTRPNEEQNLVSWAQPLFKSPKHFPEMADPLLKKNFPEKDLNQAVAIAAMCLQEEQGARPLMSDVVTALSFLSVVPPEVIPTPVSPATQPPKEGGSSGSETGRESNRQEDDGSSEEEEEDIESDEIGQDSDAMGSREFYSKSSRKSSKKSRNGSRSGSSPTSSEEGSQKSSGKSHSLNQKSSKKSSTRDLKQKRSKKTSGSGRDEKQKSYRKTSGKELSQKSGRKSSGRVISRKRSTGTGSEEGGSSRMSQSQGDISFGLISSGSGESVHSDHSSGRRSTEGMARLGHAYTAKLPQNDHRREVLTVAGAKV